jgi:hypothetical protein
MHVPAGVQEYCDQLVAGYEAQQARVKATRAAAAVKAAAEEEVATEAAPVLMRDLGSLWT